MVQTRRAARQARAGLISLEGLEALAAHKYTSSGYSALDNVMNPWWLWVCEQLPRTLAPNTITSIGVLFTATACALQLYYTPSLEGEAPRFVYVWSAFSLFVYQTLDAVDGKQVGRFELRSGPMRPRAPLFRAASACYHVNARSNALSLYFWW